MTLFIFLKFSSVLSILFPLSFLGLDQLVWFPVFLSEAFFSEATRSSVVKGKSSPGVVSPQRGRRKAWAIHCEAFNMNIWRFYLLDLSSPFPEEEARDQPPQF